MKLFSSSKSRLTAVGVLLAIVLTLALNSIVANTFRSSRIDLTAGHLYSLSEGTRTLLGKLEEPIHMRLFMSGSLRDAAPQLAAYAARVRSMLDTYATLSKGKITLEVIDPEPYSDEEDQAVGFGINRIALQGADDSIFFGLAATNSTDGKAQIPVFTPDREAFLEYDLTRLVAELGQPAKPVVTLIDGLGLAGNPQLRQPPAQIMTMLKETYDVETVTGDVDKLPDHTRVVMVVQPQQLSDRTLYTLDQWVMSGGATLVFVDPFAETQLGRGPGQLPDDNASDLDKLFKAWGIGFDVKTAVADPQNAIRTARAVAGRQIEVANYPWFAVRGDGFDHGDAITSQLQAVVLTTPGSFTVTGKDVTLQPLMVASTSAGYLPAGEAADPYGDPRALLPKIAKASTQPILAARVDGKLVSAFPAGKPEGSENGDKPIGESVGKPNLIVVADADMLSDRNWIQRQNVLGQAVAQAFANNGDFVLNAVEQMVGGVALADLRSRTVSWRPFTRINALEQSAEQKFLAKQQELTQRVQDTETKIKSIAAEQKVKQGEVIASDTSATVEKFRAELLAARAELRDVQYNLRRDVEQLKAWIMVITVGIVPLVVAIFALVFALRRPRRPIPTRKPS
jgi:ABC-type uncharacterized transport system involved in gliding motility auxiliary subunit